MSRLTRDGTAELVSRRNQILRRKRGQGNIHFPCSADKIAELASREKVVRRESGRDRKILSDHRQDGNDEVHRL